MAPPHAFQAHACGHGAASRSSRGPGSPPSRCNGGREVGVGDRSNTHPNALPVAPPPHGDGGAHWRDPAQKDPGAGRLFLSWMVAKRQKG
jgi:hypothetical protein